MSGAEIGSSGRSRPLGPLSLDRTGPLPELSIPHRCAKCAQACPVCARCCCNAAYQRPRQRNADGARNRHAFYRSGVEQILEDVIRNLVAANAHAVEFRIALRFQRLDLVTPGLNPCLRVDTALKPRDEACPEAALRCGGDVGGDIRHLETSQSK